ncbi:MAG: hypothetical protein ACFFBP_16195 [Promethearchaeota archaeon]
MAIEFAIEIAFKEALKYLNKANKNAKDDVEYCKNYLKAAQSAVIGLEKECDQILVQSKNIDLSDPEKVSKLLIRIDEYLNVDQLRPILKIALTGLNKCHKALQENSERFLQWPWKKEIRQEAVSDFMILLNDLNSYLDDLEVVYLQYRNSGTGILVQELNQIKDYLLHDRLYEIVQNELFDFVNEVQKHRDKKRMLEDTSRIEDTINDLLRAFR